MSRRFLVTGAAGFIGSHVAEALLSRGDRVVGLDDFNDYYDPARKQANLAEVEAHPNASKNFEFFVGDIRDAALLGAIFEPGVEAVVHLAAMAGVGASMTAPRRYIDVNIQGTCALLDAAQEHACRHFVFASTSSVYGTTARIPFEETDTADRPLAPYPATKRAGELLGHSYHHMYGLNFTALRFFTVYGPRGRPDMMTYKVVESMLTGREVPLYGGGRAGRDWTFVGDTAAGVLAATDRPMGYQVINLGRGEPLPLSDFLAALSAVTGRSPNLKATPMPPTDMLQTHADISKARKLLGYAPRTHVAEGVKLFWEWYQQAVLGVPVQGP